MTNPSFDKVVLRLQTTVHGDEYVEPILGKSE